MTQERTGLVTFKGSPLTLLGPEIRVGAKAPDFAVRRGLTPDALYTLASGHGKVRILSVVPSLDTKTCDLMTRRFNEEAAKLGDKVSIVTISMDLPPAQERWCGAAGVDRLTMASDYYDHSFGLTYGLRIKELGLLTRTVIILDPDDIVRYVQLVPDIADLPNFDAVLEAVKPVIEEA
jgi:thioredoxin-dependent peroxiredoxin